MIYQHLFTCTETKNINKHLISIFNKQFADVVQESKSMQSSRKMVL